MSELVLAIDIGGTKMAAGLVTAQGDLLEHAQTPTVRTPDGDELFAHLCALVDSIVHPALAAGRDLLVCGVGCGGPMTRGGATVSPVNIPAWRGYPLHGRLADHLGVTTFVDNDAKALTLGEGWKGAAVGVANFVGMVVSTGVGGGVVLDGRLLDGVDSNAGHIGHITVDPDGHLCGCGAVGCLEAEASGTAIAAITGAPAAEAGPEVIERTGVMVGRAVACAANLLDLRLAVVAGSVALGYGQPFFDAAQREIDLRCQLEFSRGTVIRPAGLGGTGPLVGAAAVGLAGLGHRVLGGSA